jgi:hypothetical protein
MRLGPLNLPTSRMSQGYLVTIAENASKVYPRKIILVNWALNQHEKANQKRIVQEGVGITTEAWKMIFNIYDGAKTAL